MTFDPINPDYYRAHPSGVECIVITEHFNFNKGNAIKYIWRSMGKGNELQDLKKAKWYIDREIAKMEKAMQGLKDAQKGNPSTASGGFNSTSSKTG